LGVPEVMNAASNLLGNLPSPGTDTGNVKNVAANQSAKGINPLDTNRYPKTPDGAMAFVTDIHKENIATQFQLLGEWQKVNDPEAYAEWQKTLADAQSKIVEFGPLELQAKAAETLSNYVRQESVRYADTTTEGVQGLYDIAPELAFGGEGSLGQGFSDALTHLLIPQRKAEEGLSFLSGRQGGLFQPLYDLSSGLPSNLGSRLNNLLSVPFDKLTPVEQQVVTGMKEQGWTNKHAYNFLVSHGQGFSSDPGSELAMSVSLDPLQVAMLGSSAAAAIPARIAGITNDARSANRIMRTIQEAADALGTTVSKVRDDPVMGPKFRVARQVLNFGIPSGGPRVAAKLDATAAVGIEGFRLGMGPTAVKDAASRAARLDVSKEALDTAEGVSAMNNVRKWGMEQLVKEGMGKTILPGDVVSEEQLQFALHNAAADTKTRIAEYTQKNREFFLTQSGQDALAERFAKFIQRPIAEAKTEVAQMSRDEQAYWHYLTFSQADSAFRNVVSGIAPEAWGNFASKVGDLALLNPQELDRVAAQNLVSAIQKATPEEALRLWNEAAGQYSLVDSIGRVTTGGTHMLDRRVNQLQNIIEQGRLHSALDVSEMKSLPAQFKRQFLDAWVDSEGNPIWRLGFKPTTDQATGLMMDADGKLTMAYAPMVDNVSDAIPHQVGRVRMLVDPLGRAIPQAVKDSRLAKAAGQMGDAMEVLHQTAMDRISGERMMVSMEQSFRRQLRSYEGAAIPDSVAKRVFRLSREYSQDHSFTIAGMSPDDFWRASEAELKDLVGANVGKRDIYTMLAKAAGGDVRTLGLSSWTTQRIRSSLIARGLDRNNYLGAVTIKLYNSLRYALNPLFFIQAEFDAPWFNMYRGVIPDLLGRAPKPGTPEAEMAKVMHTMGHTSLARDLQMDFTERITNIGWQRALQEELASLPGYERNLGEKFKRWSGQMVINNELKYINSQAGQMVFDALGTVRKMVEDKIANAASDAEREVWVNVRQDQVPMLSYLREEESKRLGRLATDNEVGLRYLTEILDDAMAEDRTPEGMLSYQKQFTKAEYHKPTDIGELRPLGLDGGAASLGLPNVSSAATLRAALGRGAYTLGDVSDMMKTLGYHPDHIKRFTTALMFNWRDYFDGLASDLGMTRTEMQGVETMIFKAAKLQKMPAVDYLTQVMPMTTAKGIDSEMKFTLDVMRAAKKGEAGMDQMTKLVTGHLQPSMKARLLDHFLERITGPNGLIETAMAAGDHQTAQSLNQVAEDLRGGWGPTADNQFRDLVIRRAGGETGVAGASVAAVPEGFTTNAMEINGGLAYPAGLKREGFFHATTNMPAVLRDGLKSSDELPAGTRGLGSAGDRNMIGRTPLVQDRAVAQEMADRLKLTSQIAKGEVNYDQMLDAFRPAYKEAFGDGAEAEMQKALAAQAPVDTVGLGKVSEATTEPGYVYHTTGADNATDISTDKLRPQSTRYRDEQAAWPDGGTGKRIYWNRNAKAVEKFQPEGKTAILRAREADVSGLTDERYTGDSFSNKALSPNKLEVLGGDGQWHPLDEFYRVAVPTATDPKEIWAAAHQLDSQLPGFKHVTMNPDFETAKNWVTEDIGVVNAAVKKSFGLDVKEGMDTSKGELDFLTKDVRVLAPGAVREIAEPEVERAARYFSQWMQEVGPQFQAGEVLKGIAQNIPKDGASPYDFTQAAMLHVLSNNLRLTETDAFRLANINPQRTVLERSLNHPFFAMYPSSYFWGKVVPETIRFLAYEPFGIRTGAMLDQYYKVQQSIALQSQYDPRIKDLWDKVGKSAVMGLLSYMSPSFPWEDMKSSLPPWVRAMAKHQDFSTMLDSEYNLFNPKRWTDRFLEAAGEAGQAYSAVNPLTSKQQQQLQQVSATPSTATPTQAAPDLTQPVQGTQLGPTLESQLQQLQQVLRSR